MSAIFGIIDFEGRPLKEEWIKSMQTDLAHRGPDGQGLYREPSVALGHMLLQVTPESVYDKSPYEEDGFVITANARLDEREAIMDRLNVPQDERDKITDPLLLLRSFRKYGKDFVKDIYGDFAFAIWDKAKKELFCARDQIGVKPFLYYFKEGRFVFSTELKSLVNLDFFAKKINQNRFLSIVLQATKNPFDTAWKDIFRLPAASHINVNKESLCIKRYWKPIYKQNKNLKKSEDSANLLRSILLKVISDQTREINSVGIPLSGGLDSSSIFCLAAINFKNSFKKIITISEVLDPCNKSQDISDEHEFIEIVIKGYDNTDHTYVYHNNFDYYNEIRKKFDKHYDIIAASYYVDETIFECFRKKNIRRILSGYLGDMTVSNSTIEPLPYLLINLRIIRFFKLLRQLKKTSGTAYTILIKRALKSIFYKPLAYIKNYLNGDEIPWYYSDLPLRLNKREKFKYTRNRSKLFSRNYFTFKGISRQIYDVDDETFEENWDCASSYHNLEITYPLLDRRVIEFLNTVPVEHFYAKGLYRGLLRETMKDWLPEIVRLRKTKGCYSPNYHEIMKHDIENIRVILKDPLIIKNLNELIDIQELNGKIGVFSNSKNSSIFTFNYWIFIYICIWISFKMWYYNYITMNKQDIKKTWKKPVILSSLSVKHTYGIKATMGSDGSPHPQKNNLS